MKTFLAYLWKEWQDHRAVVLGMFVALPVLMAIAGLTLPTVTFEGGGFATKTALSCLAIFVISVSTDLVPGEARRGRLDFLRRQPRGLTPPFVAKLVFFVVLALAYTACGWLAGAVTSRAVAGTFPDLHVADAVAWPLLVAVLWTFAVSCCLPRGVLAIPTTVALGIVLVVPLALLLRLYDLRHLEHWFNGGTVALWAAGGILAAWLAFVRGRRRGGGALAAARWCGAVVLVCILPYWAEAAQMTYAWHYSSEPRIGRAYLGAGGRYVFVSRYDQRPGYLKRGSVSWCRRSPATPLIIDLETGAVREFPGGGRSVRAATSMGVAQPVVVQSTARGGLLYDARTAEPLWDKPVEDQSVRCAPELRLAKRAASRRCLADGRRVWIFNGQLECDGPEGSVETFVTTGRGGPSLCGFGARWRRNTYFDFARVKSYSRADLGVRIDDILIRPGKWLLSRRRYEPGGGKHWGLLDPDTRVREPARGLGPLDRVCAIHDDGRLFVRRGSNGPLVLLDPETGLGRILGLPATLPDLSWVSNGGERWRPVYTPGGARVFRLHGRSYRRRSVARFDAESGTLVGTKVIEGDLDLVGCVTDDEAIVLVDKRILARVRFGTDDYEELYRVR